MQRLFRFLLVRFAPRTGWPLVLLALAAAGSPALAASDSTFAVPSGLVFLAGAGGLLFGLRLARASSWGRYLVGLPLALGSGGLLIAAGGRALPPLGLLLGDLLAGAELLVRWWSGLESVPFPAPLTWHFLSAALPRLWQELQAAPGAGQAGATLLVTSMALLSTWAGTICLGWATAGGQPTMAWGLPLLAALAAITILGGSSGSGLLLGLACLLLLAIVSGHLARERTWERLGAAYSEELRWDVAVWGILAAGLALALALMLPTRLPDSLARLFWGDVELPSGIAAIERQVQRGANPPPAGVGLSRLPALQLGVSLEQAPPETIALRIRTATPLTPAPWPRYWRARVLARYNGRSWSADARVTPFVSPLTADTTLPGAIVQEIEDLRLRQGVLVALPDVLWLDVAAYAERLPDGTMVALTGEPGGGRYRVLSLPQELAMPLDRDTSAPPDLSTYLAIPRNVPARVNELARTIAGRETSALDQALALERYLRALPYSYTVRPLPRGSDAVDQFLFEMREGYCTYYASAMALMARSLGIPARIAVGYATGSYDQADGVYLVREAEAHAWPELLIGGRWLPFEPTPIQPLPARLGAPQPAAPTVTRDEALPAPVAFAWPAAILPIAVLVGAALTIVIAVLLVGRRPTPLIQAQLRIEQLGVRAGVHWPAGATLHEYALLLEAHAGSVSPSLRELVALIEQARYGGRAFDQAMTQQARRALRAVARWLRSDRH